MPVAIEDSRSRVGTVIADKYRVTGVLGRGGMGTVYEAVHTTIGKHVALKFLEGHQDSDAQTRARFLREAQTASLVESPHVVHIFDSGWSDDGVPFMVLELLRGKDLRVLLRSEGRLPVEQAVSITEQTLRALIQTHGAGIVHRDLKPENVFLCEIEGSEPLVKILDFGISKVTSPQPALDTLTDQGTVLGTTYYMSPEQARGEPDLDARSDLYGVGAILYEMLTGRTPHVGNVHHAVLVNICTTDAPDVRLLTPQVPPELANVIARALSRDRERRFGSAQQFLNALAPFSPNHSGPKPQLPATTRVSVPVPQAPNDTTAAPNKRARSGKLIAVALVLTLLLGGLAIALVNKRLKNDREKERAKLWHQAQPVVSQALASPSASIPPRAVASTVAPAPIEAPSASVAASNTAPHRTTGARSSRMPPAATAAKPGELRLKTTMP